MSQPIFHAPDHDHERCTADALAHAETLCAQRSQRLTPIRRQVLEVLLESHKPLGAYEIMDRAALRAAARPAPITIYRALDFLRDNGLVHRIESRNAFVACVNNHASGDLVVFLICEHCGAVGRGGVGGGRRSAQDRRARRGLHAEGAGDRDRRRLRALPASTIIAECISVCDAGRSSPSPMDARSARAAIAP